MPERRFAAFIAAAAVLSCTGYAAAADLKSHRIKLREENENFRRSLEASDLSGDARKAAVASHREARYQLNKKYYDNLHKEQLAAFKAQLAADRTLTDKKRKELYDASEKQYKSFKDMRDKEHAKGKFFYT
jgi:hypothetical protein